MIQVFNSHFKKICIDSVNKKKIFVLGLSGGMDSTALLYLLKNFLDFNKQLAVEIFPVIIDHDLRTNSGEEALAVKSLALKLNFKPIIKKINVKKPTGNIQNWARKERRKLLIDSAIDLSADLLLAHHSDDQAETIFMRSTKDSGIDGLIGMKVVSYWNGISIIRPLLIFNKDQIKNYIEENKILYFNDSSNFMLKFERV